jgi:hypothetical protein
MKYLLYLILISLLNSCITIKSETGGAKKNESKEIQRDSLILNSIKLIHFNKDSLTSCNEYKYLMQKYNSQFGTFVDSNIMSIENIGIYNIKKIGYATIFKIVLNNVLPAVVKKNNYLIVTNNNESLLLSIDTIILIKIFKNDKSFLIGGINKVRDKGYFVLYDFKKERNELQEIINSLNFCENGLPVFNSSLDCVSYKPFGLDAKNSDLYHDNILDLTFKGNILFYCQGLEYGIGRMDKKPIKKANIKIDIIFNMAKDSTLSFKVKSKNVCDALN